MPDSKEHGEWMRKRAKERNKNSFKVAPVKFNERGMILDCDQSGIS